MKIKASQGQKTPRQKLSRLWVTAQAGIKTRGHLRAGVVVVHCALGAAGIGARKREGDGLTPKGRFALRGGYWRADRMARPGPRLCATKPGDGWCDAPNSPAYNRPVRLPFVASHERLWRDDHVYDVVVVLDYNFSLVRRGRGSAIFFHLARENFPPTAGCVAISRSHMRHLLPRLGKNCVMIVR